MDKNYKKILPIFTISIFLLFLVPTISAESTEIPSWVKGVANFWAEGNINDSEFGEAISFLIEQGIIVVNMPNQVNNSELEQKISILESENTKLRNEISNLKNENSKLQSELDNITQSSNSNIKSESGFSGLVCKKDFSGWVQLTGKYTNGDKAYSFLSITLAIIGENGEVLDTGAGMISNIDAHQTKVFTASSLYSGNFKSCEVQVDAGY